MANWGRSGWRMTMSGTMPPPPVTGRPPTVRNVSPGTGASGLLVSSLAPSALPEFFEASLAPASFGWSASLEWSAALGLLSDVSSPSSASSPSFFFWGSLWMQRPLGV